MNTELLGVIVTFIITVAIAIPFGKYIAKVFKGEKTILDFMSPFEKFIFKICGIDANKQMNWKQHLIALLSINMLWFVYAFIMLLTQGSLLVSKIVKTMQFIACCFQLLKRIPSSYGIPKNR